MLRSLSHIEEQTKLKDTHVANIRNERARLKSVGFTTDEVDYALKLRRSKSPEADVDEWRRRQRVAMFLQHPIGTQIDLFDGKLQPDREPIEEKAYQLGFAAGSEGKFQHENPYDPGSAAGQAWLRGWHDAQEIIARGFKQKEPEGGTLLPGNQNQAPASESTAESGASAADSFDEALADAPAGESDGEASAGEDAGEEEDGGEEEETSTDGPQPTGFSQVLHDKTVKPGEDLMRANRKKS